ncbi:hypothetical protein FLA4_08150 [Candidatus Rickettsia kotlanii]|nr:hypothetical protein FLA4_08150 [Candidatus Rickettsia kotlanii]BDU61648.1 hypothetical protein HM2_08160 [Candidatus Rickettsia kotlanii]
MIISNNSVSNSSEVNNCLYLLSHGPKAIDSSFLNIELILCATLNLRAAFYIKN